MLDLIRTNSGTRTKELIDTNYVWNSTNGDIAEVNK
jgi:hypothetical protein